MTKLITLLTILFISFQVSAQIIDKVCVHEVWSNMKLKGIQYSEEMTIIGKSPFEYGAGLGWMIIYNTKDLVDDYLALNTMLAINSYTNMNSQNNQVSALEIERYIKNIEGTQQLLELLESKLRETDMNFTIKYQYQKLIDVTNAMYKDTLKIKRCW